tara:strand:+ start:626 stop:784 length:159 start_codon:yes stop_codon:yes gene_type:complete
MIAKIVALMMVVSFFVPIDSKKIPVQALAILCQWAWYAGALLMLVWMVSKIF